ncbi:MAG TPA: selenium-dependent molybdenum cofactor biosynthesis protein YqeB [Spirochaetales bacterium]|nr:selenium-dependent molybdenum cofactor biosynthesis protein YqeB [Spirochaetales bacterium]HPS14586.1 selenium-dependent molybdenum cofactor biosynthesis protein YqeB [Spirochaetales bacterium]
MSTKLSSVVVVRGAGDLATGVIAKLASSGFLVMALETSKPTAIRRRVSLSECMYDGYAQVENVRALKVKDLDEALRCIELDVVPVLEDPECLSIADNAPMALVDAIIAKRNIGTRLSMAPIVIALGPGFVAGVDAHAVVETSRGHNLGRVLFSGRAAENTGQPGVIGGYSIERVVHAPCAGQVTILRDIGSIVEKSEPLLEVGACVVPAPLSGLVRGMIRGGSFVDEGTKIADVDPRGASVDFTSISDKARAIAGGVLEAILHLGARPQ